MKRSHENASNIFSIKKKKKKMKKFLLLLFILFLIIFKINCIQKGEYVVMLYQVQFNEYRSEWLAIAPSKAPRFGMSKTISIRPSILSPQIKKSYDEKAEKENEKDTVSEDSNYLKLQFTFDKRKQFLSSWVTISDQKTKKYLETIDFIFKYAGDKIYELKTHKHYKEELVPEVEDNDFKGIPKEVRINFHWHEIIEKDSSRTIYTLFFFSIIISFLLLVAILSTKKNF
jgi:hypothetical protein